ncbi:MAG: MG2 domain-containing protein [Prolixibacteraceae bacterium]|jgi:uncharacterized protein YfaS (alpha-2-macroglobulin family)|nr:MG2 domain-containing protein [Prolixibacteraceae bacterium]
MNPSATLRLLILFLTLFVAACSSEKKQKVETTSPDLFHEYVSGFTSGEVKRYESIVIKFTRDMVDEAQRGKNVSASVLRFDPSIEGKAIWVSTDAIEFSATKMLPWDTEYTASLKLSEVVEVPDELTTLNFKFRTPQKQFAVSHTGLELSPQNSGMYSLGGEIKTSDIFTSDEVENLLVATQNDNLLKIEWEHNPKVFSHKFEVQNIERLKETSAVRLQWDGSSVGVKDESNEATITVPSLLDFNVSSARVIQQPDQYVEVNFSDPVNAQTDLRGLVLLDGQPVARFKTDNNTLKIYPPKRISGIHTLKLNGAIESINGYKLDKEVEYSLNFGGLKPAVKLLGNGVIVPKSDELYFPFEAAALSAVDLRITKIFTNNIHSFLQENNYNNDYRLSRVGRIIHRSKIDLTDKGASDLQSWNGYNINLSKFVDIEPGAIYNVEIGFRKAYSLYNCNNSQTETDEYVPIDQEELYPSKNYRSVYYNNYSNWQLRDEACEQAYFSPDKFLSRNILGSDFGIIAKLDESNNTYMAITSLLTAQPVNKAEIELYDYQNQLITTGNTDKEGMLKLSPERKPFLLIVRKDKMIGYLKIDNNTLLSTSNFDVEGQNVKEGVKGFIYGERGVWRPGDSVFVSFILEDKLQKLPQGHPLIFELYNPKGQFVQKMTQACDERTIYPFFFKTGSEAPTGNWQAVVRAGTVKFSKTIRVETVKPNRLKVEIKFDDELLSAQKKTSGTLESKWLHGASAKGLKAKVDVSFNSYTPKFDNYTAYDFSTPYDKYYGQEITLFDDKLDDKGKADLSFEFEPNREVSGFLRASFVTKVFEKGGDFSINFFTKPFSPYSNYVGLNIDWSYHNWNKLDNDKAHEIKVATVDGVGNPVSVKNIEVKLYELEYRWWYSGNHENLASYAGRTYHKPVFETTLNSSDGESSFSIGDDAERWGRHLLLVTSPDGHTAGQVIYFGYPWGRSPHKGGAQMLALVTEQDRYNVGDEVTVSFPANDEARALVSIESGKGLLAQEWVENLSEFTHYKFKATPEMTPNIYVSIMLVQPHGQTANDLPIRLFGVVPIMVEDPDTHIEPEIKMPEELRPLREFTIKVSEKNKNAMDYTIAIVDEGLLDLTNFSTPQPWPVFYAREALNMRTYDMYNYVMGAFGSRLESMFAIGGSDAISDDSKKKSERFKPVVKVLGPFHLKARRTDEHKITLPQYVGSVRTMVIAAGNGSYGHTEETTPVREPLMVLATLPRVLSPGETVDLPVSIFAMKDNIRTVNVNIESNDYLKIIGNADTTVIFKETGEKDITFKVQSALKTGMAKLKVVVESGRESSFHEIELDIRQPNPPTIKYEFKMLKPGESFNETLSDFGMDGTNHAQLELSGMPPLNLGFRLKYLIRYPHGCIEQITSAAFPQLYLPKLLSLDEAEQKKIHTNIEACIGKYRRYQTSDGGFAYWPGGTRSGNWASTYVGHFLIEAENAGYLVPGNLKNEVLNYIRNEAAGFNPANQNGYMLYAQAYRLYLLALGGEAQLSSMNRMRAVTLNDNQTRWMLAGAYALAGMKEAAYQHIDFRNMKPDEPHRYSYGSYLRDQSVILQTLLALGETEHAATLALEISNELSSQAWYSTQTTAFSLVALANFAKATNAGKEINYELTANGNTKELVSNQYTEKVDLPINAEGQCDYTIENKGNNSLFVIRTIEGVKPGVDKESKSDGLQLNVSYSMPNGSEIDPLKITQGTDFEAKVTVYNKRGIRVENVALEQMFPAGWEIINARLFGNSDDSESTYDYRDIRDDRVYTYFSLGAYETKKFKVRLNATYSGTYILPPVSCGAMYMRSFSAKIAGREVKVTK